MTANNPSIKIENADGYSLYDSDGNHLQTVYDWAKIAFETGYTVEDVKMRGVSWCRRNRKTKAAR